MYLCITFPNELIPFQLFSSDEECLRAIRTAREQGWDFNEASSTVRSDSIILHAFRKNKSERNLKKRKRYYVLGDKCLLATDCDCPDEVISTKELLAYENGCDVKDIGAIEV